MSAGSPLRPFSGVDLAGAARNAGGVRGSVSRSEQGRIDWPLTLRNGKPAVLKDIKRRPRRHALSPLWLVVLDASGSTTRGHALANAKGVLQTLLMSAYHARARIALIEVSGVAPLWRARGRRPPKNADHWLEDIGVGGGTPLSHALAEGMDWLARRHRQQASEEYRLFLFTDGRVRDLPAVPLDDIQSLLIDIESGPVRIGKSQQIAAMLGAAYVHIDNLPQI